MRLAAPALLFVAAALAAPPARAQPGHDPAVAQKLFDRADALQAANDWEGACAKFEASMDLDPATSTQIRIARCHVHFGKLAHAWADYRAALTSSPRLPGQTDQRTEELRALAEKELGALAPRIPRLRVVLHGAPPGLRLTRDGQDLPVATLGEELPVDPGRVEIVAEAPGYVTARREVVAVEGQAAVVEVTLEPAPIAVRDAVREDAAGPPPSDGRQSLVSDASLASTPTTPPAKLGKRRIAGLVVGAAGVVGLGVAAGFGIDTLSKVRASSSLCTPTNMCHQAGLDLRAAASRSQTAGLVSLGVGAAFATTGIALFATAPPRAGATAPLAVIVGPSGGALRGLW